jgi:hypothetical protein
MASGRSGWVRGQRAEGRGHRAEGIGTLDTYLYTLTLWLDGLAEGQRIEFEPQ